MLIKIGAQRAKIIQWEYRSQFADGGGNPRRGRLSECHQTGARFYKHPIAVAVIAAVEFQNSIAFGVATRGSKRTHHSLGAAADEAQFFNERHHCLDATGQRQFASRRRAEGKAFFHGFGHRVDHVGVRMA